MKSLEPIYKINSLAVLKEGRFFERSDGRRGKIIERMPSDRATAVRFIGGQHDIIFWDENPELEYSRI